MKEITKLGRVRGNHQSGLVLSRGGTIPTIYSVQYKDPYKTVRYFGIRGGQGTMRDRTGTAREFLTEEDVCFL